MNIVAKNKKNGNSYDFEFDSIEDCKKANGRYFEDFHEVKE